MFCPGCGTQLREICAFCPRCGRDLQHLREHSRGLGLAGTAVPAVPWRGGQVVLGIALVGIAFLLISAATLLLERLGGGLAWGAWLSSHAIGLVILVTVWLLGQHGSPMSLDRLGLRQPRISWAAALLLTALVLVLSLGMTALYAWLMKPLGMEILAPPDVPREIVFSGIGAVLTFEALAGWTPLTEEIFFRGFVMAGLVSRWGIVGAAVASSLIFAVFHLHPGVLVPIFLTGLLLAALYQVTGSLWPPIIAHAGQNAIALAAIIYWG